MRCVGTVKTIITPPRHFFVSIFPTTRCTPTHASIPPCVSASKTRSAVHNHAHQHHKYTPTPHIPVLQVCDDGGGRECSHFSTNIFSKQADKIGISPWKYTTTNMDTIDSAVDGDIKLINLPRSVLHAVCVCGASITPHRHLCLSSQVAKDVCSFASTHSEASLVC